MIARRLLLVLVVVGLCGTPLSAWSQSAAESFAQGKAALGQGEFQAALDSFAAAARADRNNPEYLQQYALLRQIIELRGRLAGERDPERWEYMARALHSYYCAQGLYGLALDVSQQIHQSSKDASSATLVAETALAMDRNDVAAEALASLDEGQSTTASRALLGVALARQGRQPEARKIAHSLQVGQDESAGALYSVARLQAATGDIPAALASLARCFESIPPSRLEGFKQHARQCDEFAAVASTAEFQKVLLTDSKIAESKCSGGSSCAGCPMRGKCAHAQQEAGGK